MPLFFPYQRAWVRDTARLKICQKSRQVGLSYADSYDSVRKAAVRPGGRDVWVMSRDEVQAKQYIRYCARWARVLHLAGGDYGQRVLRLANGKSASVQVLAFANGSSIYALSSNPDAIVGKTGHVKLDEFALHKDQRTLYAVAKPVIQWGGTLSVISTHRGIGTVFNQLIIDIQQHGNTMGWSLHTIPIQRAVEEGLVEKIDAASHGSLTSVWQSALCPLPNPAIVPLTPLTRRPSGTLSPSDGERDGGRSSVQGDSLGASELSSAAPSFNSRPSTLSQWWLAQQRAECIDEEQWLQEYCCVPADENSAFISYELLNACTEPGLQLCSVSALEALAQQSRVGSWYLGVDVARKKDLCVLDLGEKIGDVVWDRVRLELLNRPFGEIEEALYRLLRLPQLKRACLDASGLGLQLAERARERFGYKIEPITFTAPVKEELALGLKIDLEKRQLRLADDEKLRADLRGIRKQVTLSGNTRYGGEAEGSHCDRFWAKALRQHAARHKVYAGARLG